MVSLFNVFDRTEVRYEGGRITYRYDVGCDGHFHVVRASRTIRSDYLEILTRYYKKPCDGNCESQKKGCCFLHAEGLIGFHYGQQDNCESP